MKLRIVAISDTHFRHHQVAIPGGDILIHAGDLTRTGDVVEFAEVMHYFSRLPHRIVFIGGNHDWCLERHFSIAAKYIPAGFHYLEDTGCEIAGVKIWGSPVQPEFLGWAYNRKRGAEIDRHWQKIPKDTDIVVSHGPCHGILDRVVSGEHVGCEMLRRRLEEIRPKLHICGHIHSAYGTDQLGPTTMVNASVCTERYEAINAPIVIDLENGVAAIRSSET